MTRLLESFLKRITGLRVYALIGKSGTGKSFRAQLIAERYRIPLIIDDGLLIHEGALVAGRSAKKEANYLAAVKTAVFEDPLHRQEVVDALRRLPTSKVLVLGTSVKMVRLVVERLGLSTVDKWIHIEEVATEEEIQTAQAQRNKGRHVIPASRLEVGRHHASIILDSFFVRGKKAFEKTVVSPPFHKKNPGQIALSEPALREMVLHCVDEFDSSLKILRLKLSQRRQAWRVMLTIDAPYGRDLPRFLASLQGFVRSRLERYTGLQIDAVDVDIHGIR